MGARTCLRLHVYMLSGGLVRVGISPSQHASFPSLPPPRLSHPGTVIPAQDSLHAAVSVGQFKQRNGGQGAFVVGPLQGQLLGAAASVQLVTQSGIVLTST